MSISFALFLLIFFIIFMSGAYFSIKVFLELLGYDCKHKHLFKNKIFIITSLYSLSMFIAMWSYNGLGIGRFYAIIITILGLFSILLLVATIYFFLKILSKNSILFKNKKYNKILRKTFVFIFVFLCIISFGSTFFYQKKSFDIKSDKLDRNYKFVLISDLHIGAIYRHNFLNRIINDINKINPDFVVLPGDLVDNIDFFDSRVIEQLNKFTMPVFFTLGNHELYQKSGLVQNMLSQTNFITLEDENIYFDGINIVGITDISNRGDSIPKDINKSFENIHISKTGFNLALFHQPTELENFHSKGIDLMVCGHTHNGQILPYGYLVKLRYDIVNGLDKYKDMFVLVTQGIGTWGPPMRLGTNSEIVIVNLLKNK